MWILRYLILATRQRCNALLDRRTRMNFDPLHGCPMYVCADKAEWDRRGKDQVAQLESELRMDIEAYHTETGERRVIKGEMIEVRPVLLDRPDGAYGHSVNFRVLTPEGMQKYKESLKETESAQGSAAQAAPETEPEVEETILPEAAPETEAVPAPTGDALVSSGVEAQAEAEPGAAPTSLEKLTVAEPSTARQTVVDGGLPEEPDQNQSHLASDAPSTEVPEPVMPTEAAAPKAKTKPAGKAGKK